MWFGAHYNQEVRFSSRIKCKKGPEIIIIIITESSLAYPLQRFSSSSALALTSTGFT